MLNQGIFLLWETSFCQFADRQAYLKRKEFLQISLHIRSLCEALIWSNVPFFSVEQFSLAQPKHLTQDGKHRLVHLLGTLMAQRRISLHTYYALRQDAIMGLEPLSAICIDFHLDLKHRL